MPECNRPHQSDMEQKHELWVHDLITFLHANNVQTYEGGWNANSLEGMRLPKGKTLEPSERLNIFQATLHTRARKMQNLRDRLGAEILAHLKTEAHLKTAEDMLENLWVELTGGSGALGQESLLERLEVVLKERRPYLLEPELLEEEADDVRA